MKRMGRGFFERKPERVARELLGKLLVRQEKDFLKIGIITETEAYLGFDDKASHSSKGMTKRNEVMFGPAGHAYVYFSYGMHWLLNFITEKEGNPSGVLIRKVTPIYDSEQKELPKILGAGPARLTKWMKIDGSLNRVDVTESEKLFVADEFTTAGISHKSQKINKEKIITAPRIGVDYAGEDAALPLRFYIEV